MLKTHIICICTAVLIFLIDINIALGVAGGVPYILLVFIALRNHSQKLIYFYAILGTLLTLLGYSLSPTGGEHWKVLANRGLAIFAVWITAVVCLRLIKSIQDLTIKSKVLEQSPNGIIITDQNGTIEYVNEAFSKITGFPEKEVLGANPKILNSGKNAPELYQEMWHNLTAKKNWHGDLINLRKSGEEVWVHLSIYPVLNLQNEITHYVYIERDLTKVRSSESALVKSEKRLRDLVEATPMCIHEIDKEGKLCSMNSAGLAMMGVQEEKEIIGLDYCSLPGKEKQAEIKKLMKQAFDGQSSFFEFSITNEHNEELFFESCFKPIFDTDGNIEKLMGVSQNVSERKKAERLIQEALEAANESNRVKEEFLSVVSHELRTPMNGIFGTMELLREEVDDEIFEALSSSSIRLMSTIDDILSFISLSKKSTVLKILDFDIGDLQKTITARTQQISIIEDLHSHLKIHWQGWSGRIHSDFTLLESIIWNLFSNALKFTSKGDITLTATLDKEKLIIDVIDSGCGIDKERQDIIFKEFKQIDSSISRNYEGLGIGLALSIKQADLLDGKLELVSSTVGKGTHLRLIIPNFLKLRKVLRLSPS